MKNVLIEVSKSGSSWMGNTADRGWLLLQRRPNSSFWGVQPHYYNVQWVERCYQLGEVTSALCAMPYQQLQKPLPGFLAVGGRMNGKPLKL